MCQILQKERKTKYQKKKKNLIENKIMKTKIFYKKQTREKEKEISSDLIENKMTKRTLFFSNRN